MINAKPTSGAVLANFSAWEWFRLPIFTAIKHIKSVLQNRGGRALSDPS